MYNGLKDVDCLKVKEDSQAKLMELEETLSPEEYAAFVQGLYQKALAKMAALRDARSDVAEEAVIPTLR